MTEDSRAGSRQSHSDSVRFDRRQIEQAEKLRRQGDLDRAESICTELLQRRADDFAACHVLGRVHADQGDYERAGDCLRQAAQLNPRSSTILIDLAGVYVRLESLALAAETLKRARALDPHEPAVVVNVALARAYAAAGRYREAASMFESLWDQGQRTLDVLTGLIELPAQFVHKDILGELANVTRDPGRPDADFDNDAMFVRAAALDKLGRYEEAWRNALAANRAIAARVGNELAAETAMRARKLEAVRANASPLVPAARDDGLPISLFILGPSRCGKTSLETVLAGLPGVRRGYENPALEHAIRRTCRQAGLSNIFSLGQMPPRYYPQLRAFYGQELTRRAAPARVFTSTLPGYIDDAALIASVLPNARFVFVKRNVEDNVLRMFMRRYRRGNFHSYEVNAARRYVEWYHAMIDALAQRMPDIACIVGYEDMIADASTALGVAVALCDLPMSQRALATAYDDRHCAAPYRRFMNAAAE